MIYHLTLDNYINNNPSTYNYSVIWESTTSSTVLTKTQDGSKITYKAAFIRPLSGWFGFFIQMSFAGLESSVIQITTETNVIPEIFPFP